MPSARVQYYTMEMETEADHADDTVGTSLHEFVEIAEVLDLVDNLPSAVGEIAEQRFSGECHILYNVCTLYV